MSNTDRIEKELHLRAPRARVWSALTDAAQFSEWFRMKLEGPFVAGGATRGRITIPGYEHVTVAFEVESIEPQTRFAYRWHPYAVDPKVDYAGEAPTLVEFTLRDHEGGTLLTVVESGFDKLPAHRRDEAFRMNTEGWQGQMKNIERYVSG